ncbi:MAG: sulfate reduction electron transfer complex DsrMKJOP subunit DsrM [Deltaproteobacteria bacterium]|nr:sulfate reduction electron transfer complex DsrMKJOP subunit DsrM [Deltaproteobacteria bacterium]
MNFLFSMSVALIAVTALVLIPLVGVYAVDLRVLFGVIIPYAAILLFFGGMVWRVIKWGRSPVPFRIPTTCGQQKTLPWIKWNKVENPCTKGGVIIRMLFEVLLFRSLFRNTQLDYRQEGPRAIYGSEKFLWLAAIAFHYCFLVIFLRHFRLFLENVPFFVPWLERVDGWLEVGVPGLYMTDLIILGALGWLFVRRVIIPQIRYISLPADYFPLLLIVGIVISGILMRYFLRVDVVGIKEFVVSLFSLKPKINEGIGTIFYVHLFLVSALIAYFPFSKLVHLGGVFLSPTRNLPNDSRIRRHVNPWNYPVKVHGYAAYEDEFREKMIEAGLPVEKES